MKEGFEVALDLRETMERFINACLSDDLAEAWDVAIEAAATAIINGRITFTTFATKEDVRLACVAIVRGLK